MKKILMRQSQLARELTRSIKKYNSDKESVQTAKYCSARLAILHELWGEYKENHATILSQEENGQEDVMAYLESDAYYDIQDLYLVTVGRLEEQHESLVNQSRNSPDQNHRSTAMEDDADSGEEEFSEGDQEAKIPLAGTPEQQQGYILHKREVKGEKPINVKLPEVKMPIFEGGYQEWLTFKDLYVDMIHTNSSLTTMQKFHYLKASLAGKAAKLIQRYVLSMDNYEVAWRELRNRYDNTKALVEAQLEAIFSLSPIQSENAVEISDLIDTVTHSLETLKTLTGEESMDHPMMVFWAKRCLPPDTRKLWESHISSQTQYPVWSELRAFLENRFRALEAMTTAKGNKDVSTSAKGVRRFEKGKLLLTNHASHVLDCKLCNEQHQIWKCHKFIGLPIAVKRTTVREKGLCWNCLSSGHVASSCTSSIRCRVCNQRHHSLLHDNGSTRAIGAGQSREDKHPGTITKTCKAESDKEQPTTVTANTVISHHRTVLLPTAIITIVGENGSELPCRALIDQGSQTSFITNNMVQQLRLRRQRSDVEFIGVGSLESKKSKYRVDMLIKGDDQDIPVSAQVLKTLTGLMPGRCVSIGQLGYLQDLKLADPQYLEPRKIDVILGAEVYAQIILDGLRTGPKGYPIAQRTRLGWILSGEVTHSSPEPSESRQIVASHHVVVAFTQSNLECDLKRFWEIEEVPSPPTMTDEDRQCEELYTSTTRRTEDGRYEVRLPWKSQERTVGSGREVAFSRLLQLERRFARDQDLKEKYNDCMQGYISNGYVERVPEHELPGTRITYLPHQPVVKRANGDTKVRIVFDASQASETGTSLNNELVAGPPLQNDISKVILRWRVHRVAFTADIQSMYHQIRVFEQDRDVQRFLWRSDASGEVQEWRLTRVVFGMTPAPYLALRTIKQLCQDYGTTYPLAADVLHHETYVDDIMSGANTLQEAVTKRDQLVSMLKCGAFTLHKWMANDQALIPETVKEDCQPTTNLGPHDTVKILGILWNASRDTLEYKIDLPDRRIHTKRSLLSDLFKIYDPLGWIGPVITQAKILLQEIWLRQLTWDEELPADLSEKWEYFRQSLPKLSGLRIPRWLSTRDGEHLYIHGFSDASLAAYGAAVYVRTNPATEPGRSILLLSKSKVAPIKPVTLPRLELCGAVLLARVLHHVAECLPHAVIEAAWSDSTIVLSWIRGRPRTWKMFVANRVSEIHDKVGAAIWRHVPSESNSADCLSRGLDSEKLLTLPMWWSGPEWMNLPCSEWPKDAETGEVQLERKPTLAAYVASTEDQENELEQRYSSMNRLLRVSAYCLRFIRSARVGFQQPGLTQELHAREVHEARLTWIRVVQHRTFATEISSLQQGKPLPARSSILNLNPFMCENKLLRVGGRLKNADMSSEQKHPVILPRTGHFVTLLIREAHEYTLHGGTTLVLGMIRRKYWILRGRTAVNQCIHHCVVCRRHRKERINQLMGDLPAPRVTVSRPFTHTGVDFCGPFDVHLRDKGLMVKKMYIAIFICFATKAVHLEVVSSLSTEAFIASFRRFAARRGLCTDMYSDCGTNFIGADKQLQRDLHVFTKKIQPGLARELSTRGINWHFNPPAAPHFGGLWEAGVKSIKYHLRRVAGGTVLNGEDFNTLVVQIEGCLNSRPIAPLSDDPEDTDALTPGHFIMAGPPMSHPEPSLAHHSPGNLTRWQLTQRLVQGFWKRWSSEYLSRLQQRPKWLKERSNLKVDDLVIIREANLPPAKWRLARVLETHPGDDGLVRVLTLRTATSVIQRPVVQVCPLLDS